LGKFHSCSFKAKRVVLVQTNRRTGGSEGNIFFSDLQSSAYKSYMKCFNKMYVSKPLCLLDPPFKCISWTSGGQVGGQASRAVWLDGSG